MIATSWILLVCGVLSLNAFPQVSDTSSLVISSTTPSVEKDIKESKEDQYDLPKIYDMSIESNVSNRYAKTLIKSKVKNFGKAAKEVVFEVVIPDQAFISGFIMEIDGKKYEAYVEEKEQAKNTYQAAVASGQTAGHVAVSARDSNRFTVSVNIEPESKVTFSLKYEELLKRENEKYQLVMNIHPGQPVKRLQAKVNIAETRPIKFVNTPALKTGNEIAKEDENLIPNAIINNVNKTSAVVIFSPNIEEQKKYASSLGTKENEGFSGQFIVEYDVERDPQGGEVLLDNGYFVHFFAPADLPPLPKQVVFVLDTSGSMEGIRITQLKEAMKRILSDLKKDDIFNIVEFNGISKVWNIEAVEVQHESGKTYWYGQHTEADIFKNKTEQPLPPAYPATEENIKKAEQVVDKLNAFGGTDIQTALKIGIQLVQHNLLKDKAHQPLIIFLTDGEPTVGETYTDKIISTISELNADKTPIFSLSFGDGADRKFLEKISLKNFGFARHIYEAADASLQLREFFKQISSPLLSNVSFNYVSNVTDVTKRRFPILFGGSELVVAGIADEGFQPPLVECWGINGPVTLIPKVETAVSSIERLWAYLTLKQILEQREQADNKTGPTQEALRLALKYSFVSDVTSLVVVKPNETHAIETEDGSKSAKGDSSSYLASFAVPLAPSANAGLALSGGFSYVSTPFAFGMEIAEAEEESDAQVYSTSETNLDQKLIMLKHELPWISSVLNGNETISLLSGTYGLGLNETAIETKSCSNSPSKLPGKCVLLYECTQVFAQLADQQTYEKYFCELERYAGICCPDEVTTTVSSA